MEHSSATSYENIKTIFLDFKNNINSCLNDLKAQGQKQQEQKQKYWLYRFFIFRNLNNPADQKCATELHELVNKYLIHENTNIVNDSSFAYKIKQLNLLHDLTCEITNILKKYDGFSSEFDCVVETLSSHQLTQKINKFLGAIKTYIAPFLFDHILNNEDATKKLNTVMLENLGAYTLQAHKPGVHDILGVTTFLRKQIMQKVKTLYI